MAERDLYRNRDFIPDFDAIMAETEARSRAFADRSRVERNVRYGETPRQSFDLVFPPEPAPAAPLHMFIHGGYWRSLDAAENHQLAAGALACGLRVAFIEYPLCPDVSLESLCDSVIAAIGDIADVTSGDLILAGHSAGGHLVTHAVTQHSGLPDTARARIKRVVSISGLHDLRPLAQTTDIGATLGLDMPRAGALSPALSQPDFPGDLLCVVGAEELAELKRQSHLLANIWTGLGVATQSHELAGEHHFSVVEALRGPGTALTRWCARLRPGSG